MQVRLAEPADVPRLLGLVREYWDFEDIAGFDAARSGTLLTRLCVEPALGRAWLAESAGRLRGYLIAVRVLSLEHQDVIAEIDEFFVLPGARAHGVGAALLDAAQAALAADGCPRLQLQLGVGNSAARAFYERRGFSARDAYELLDKALVRPSRR